MTPTPPPDRAGALAGSLLGTAVGDALGLPREGLAPGRAARWYGPSLEHRLLPGRRGLVSDDTEHACMTAQALLAAPGDPEAFARSLAWRLRGWLLGLPGGVGFATLRALLKLWLGVPPHRSGVRSAGNGPVMRAPLLGVCLGDGPQLRAVVRASTRLTHTDPRAEEGARLAALAAWHGSRSGAGLDPGAVLEALRVEVQGAELAAHLEVVAEHLRRGSEPPEVAAALGLERGVTGYVNHTVPVVLFCWLRRPGDFAGALTDVVSLGGDADTTGAILGGISGATLGQGAIPPAWIDGIAEWPRSTAWIRRLAGRLARRFPTADGVPAPDGEGPLPLAWPGLLPRNAFFMAVILIHGFRRLLPPY